MKNIASLAGVIDRLNEKIGRAAAWAAIAMVLVQFLVVVMRYIFGIGSIMLQESVIYLHASLFMIGAAYTLLHDGHVRVDILYREASEKRKALVDLLGVILFLIPVFILIWWGTWPYVVNSWKVFEGSKETSGIQAVFLLKTIILVFSALMILQGVSMGLRSFLVLVGFSSQARNGDGY